MIYPSLLLVSGNQAGNRTSAVFSYGVLVLKAYCGPADVGSIIFAAMFAKPSFNHQHKSFS